MQIDRYHRQTLLPQIGTAGQQRIARARVLLVGCGALGCSVAEQLVRGGIGLLRIVDRDLVELTNLQRQTLFTEAHSRDGTPKAIAAHESLQHFNSQVAIEPLVIDVDSTNIEALLNDVGQVIDATDNVATRYLLNDAAIKRGVPWIYGACVGMEGRAMTILPGVGPCLRCIFPTPPSASELPTCDTAGVLGAAVAVAASLQVVAALKLILGEPALSLQAVDVWTGRMTSTPVADARRDDCPCCAARQFEFLNADSNGNAKLCGRDAVQVRSTRGGDFSLSRAAAKLRGAGAVTETPFMVRCDLHEGGLRLTAFADGRVIVQGTTDPGRARAVVARFVGA